MLIYCHSVRKRHNLTRSGILQPAFAWCHLYDNGDESSLLNLTDFSKVVFEEMHQYSYGDVQEQTGPGKRRLSLNKDELSLILFYFGSSMNVIFCLDAFRLDMTSSSMIHWSRCHDYSRSIQKQE